MAGDTTGAVNLVNASGPLRVHGGELFAVFNREPFIVTAYYAATDGVLSVKIPKAEEAKPRRIEVAG